MLTNKQKDRICIYIGLGLAGLMIIGLFSLIQAMRHAEQINEIRRGERSAQMAAYQACIKDAYPKLRPFLFGLYRDENGQKYDISQTDAAINCRMTALR